MAVGIFFTYRLKRAGEPIQTPASPARVPKMVYVADYKDVETSVSGHVKLRLTPGKQENVFRPVSFV
jgi:hypothetical protein